MSEPDQPTPAAAVSVWERAKALAAEGVAPGAVAQALIAQGVDAEAARIVANSLPDAPPPPELPSAQVDLGTNALSPNSLSLLALGLEGDRRVVGTYWMAFSGVLTVISVGFWALTRATDEHNRSGWAEFEATLTPLLVVAAIGCFIRGFWLWKSTVRIRRRQP